MQLTLDASIANVPATERTASELDDMESLVRTYRPRLLRFVAFSIGDADLAESITQDCFLKAYNARDRFRGDCSISTWLTSIAVNLVRDHQRVQKFRFWRQARATAIDITDAANFLPSPESSPESRLLVKEKAAQVYAALQNLSPNQRTVFLMRFFQDLELSEIASITTSRSTPSKRTSTRTQIRAQPGAHRPIRRPAHYSPNAPPHPASPTQTRKHRWSPIPSCRRNSMNYHPDQIAPITVEDSPAAHLAPDHLTPDQIEDRLIGDLAAAPAAHLAACTLCNERVAAAGSPIASFQQVSSAWSERLSATLPIPIPSQKRPVWQRHTAWATATLSMALGFSFINATHQFSILNTPPPAASSSTSAYLAPVSEPTVAPHAPALTDSANVAPAPRTAQISADNRILLAIDASFAPATDSPAALGLLPAATPHPGPLTIQD